MRYIEFCAFLYKLTSRRFDDKCRIEFRWGSTTKKNRKGFIISGYISCLISIALALIKPPLTLWFLVVPLLGLILGTHVYSFGIISYTIQFYHFRSKTIFQSLINEYMQSKEQFEHIDYNQRHFYIKRKNDINFVFYKGEIREKKHNGFISILITNRKIVLKTKKEKRIIKKIESIEALKTEIAKFSSVYL